jgi:DNA-binding transcriptional ArsR family regulator
MLETLITSKTRLKLLFKFFLNTNNHGYLRSLEKEFDENSNAIRLELNRLEEAEMLEVELQGNRKVYRANKEHPLLADLQSILRKFAGIDQLIERVVDRLGNLDLVYLDGEIAKGIKSDIIDVILIGDNINQKYVIHLLSRAEPIIKKKVRYLILTNGDAEEFVRNRKGELFLIWENEK